jgi:alkylhydroperoxidase/carboxymuconolactone decarboxylase family protein YurZ
MATLTACAAQRATDQVRDHIRNALDVGITPEEIVELFMMLAFYGSLPGSYNSLALAQEVFQERRIAFTPPTLYDATVDPQTLYDRGLARHQTVTPDAFGYHPLQPTLEEYDLDVLRQEYCWGAIWSRPGLDMKSRIICVLAALLVLGQYSISTRRMIEGALRYGITRNEVMEIGLHLMLYAGLVPAQIFMNIASSVFRSPEFASGDEHEPA